MSKKFFFAVLGSLLAGVAVGLFFLSLERKVPTPRPIITPVFSPTPQSRLKEVVAEALIGTQGKYAVTVKNLKTKESYGLNENEVFEAASLYKLWILAAAYDQITQGKLSEDEILNRNVTDLNTEFGIASEEAELTDGVVTMTVAQALERMIIISHNYAALLLSDRIKLVTVKEFLARNGLSKSSIGEPPQTTAADVALFLEKLYKGELGNPENTTKMLETLKKQTLNHKLPRLLQAEIVVAHKTGEIGLFTHDAGIVFSKKGDYIIVVLSESDYPPGAEQRIGKISQAVYDYFASL